MFSSSLDARTLCRRLENIMQGNFVFLEVVLRHASFFFFFEKETCFIHYIIYSLFVFVIILDLANLVLFSKIMGESILRKSRFLLPTPATN